MGYRITGNTLTVGYLEVTVEPNASFGHFKIFASVPGDMRSKNFGEGTVRKENSLLASPPVAPTATPLAMVGAADRPGSAKSNPLPQATKDAPFVNSLGQQFVPVPETKVLFCRTDVRVRDFRQYAKATGYEQTDGAFVLKVKTEIISGGGHRQERTTTSWELDSSASSEKPGFEQTDDHPVVCVSWKEAHDFCMWLSKQEGRTYRLPTDAEWSAAVGGGKYPSGGNGWPPLKGAGDYLDDAFVRCSPAPGGHKLLAMMDMRTRAGGELPRELAGALRHGRQRLAGV